MKAKFKVEYYLDVRGSALSLKFREANNAVRDGGLVVTQEWTDNNVLIRIVNVPPKA
jgi:hypothetical protein